MGGHTPDKVHPLGSLHDRRAEVEQEAKELREKALSYKVRHRQEREMEEASCERALEWGHEAQQQSEKVGKSIEDLQRLARRERYKAGAGSLGPRAGKPWKAPLTRAVNVKVVESLPKFKAASKPTPQADFLDTWIAGLHTTAVFLHEWVRLRKVLGKAKRGDLALAKSDKELMLVQRKGATKDAASEGKLQTLDDWDDLRPEEEEEEEEEEENSENFEIHRRQVVSGQGMEGEVTRLAEPTARELALWEAVAGGHLREVASPFAGPLLGHGARVVVFDPDGAYHKRPGWVVSYRNTAVTVRLYRAGASVPQSDPLLCKYLMSPPRPGLDEDVVLELSTLRRHLLSFIPKLAVLDRVKMQGVVEGTGWATGRVVSVGYDENPACPSVKVTSGEGEDVEVEVLRVWRHFVVGDLVNVVWGAFRGKWGIVTREPPADGPCMEILAVSLGDTAES